MEQKQNRLRPGAATDEPASPADSPHFEPPPLLSDCLGDRHAGTIDESLASTLAESFPPGSRKPRRDGWTPEVVGGFLRHLAAGGVVEHAARAVGRSVASAYAFRNRRQGRAFARMWDAVLVHRARARLASELQGRAIAGCVSVRRKDGEIVSEYHYYDNRLAMSLLSRLDRIAEREQASEAHLRTLSEDLDDFCECLEAGGDADAFVEQRKPAEPEAAPARLPPDDDPELTRFALMAGCHHYRDIHPLDIEVRDLDPTRRTEWDDDQWVRAFRSGFMVWLSIREESDKDYSRGPGAPLRYHFARIAAAAAEERGYPADEDAGVETADLDTAAIPNWTDDQLARAWASGLLAGLPADFWDGLAVGAAEDGAEE